VKDDLDKERKVMDRTLACVARVFHMPNLFYQYEILHDIPINSIGRKLTVCFCILMVLLYLPLTIYYQSTQLLHLRKWDIGVEFANELAARGNDRSQLREYVNRTLREKFSEVKLSEEALTEMQCPCQGMDALLFKNFANIRVNQTRCETLPDKILKYLFRATAVMQIKDVLAVHEQVNLTGTPLWDLIEDPARGREMWYANLLENAQVVCRTYNETGVGCFWDALGSAGLTLCNVFVNLAAVEVESLLQSWLPYSGELLTPTHWDSMQQAMRKTFVRQVETQINASLRFGDAQNVIEQPYTRFNQFTRYIGAKATWDKTSWQPWVESHLLDVNPATGEIGGRLQEPGPCDWQSNSTESAAHCSSINFLQVLLTSNGDSVGNVSAMLTDFEFDYGKYANRCWSKAHQCKWTEEAKMTYMEIFEVLFACLGSIIMVAKTLTSTFLVFFLKRPTKQETEGVAQTSSESTETGAGEAPVLDANDDCHHSSEGTACVGVEVVQTDEKGDLIQRLMKQVEELQSQIRVLEERQMLLESRCQERQLHDESQKETGKSEKAQQQYVEMLASPPEARSGRGDAVAVPDDEPRASKEQLMNMRVYV